MRVRVLVAVPDAQLGLLTGNRFLQATIALPATLVSDALAVPKKRTASTKSAPLPARGCGACTSAP